MRKGIEERRCTNEWPQSYYFPALKPLISLGNGSDSGITIGCYSLFPFRTKVNMP